MKLKPIMKWHRAFQLIGLYGVLFLIPTFQEGLNDLGSAKEEEQRQQTYIVVKHLYGDVKQLVCETLGEESSTHDCKKGIYQNDLLNFSLEQETRIDKRQSKFLLLFKIIYYIFAVSAFIGAYLEYRNEYKDLHTNQ